MVPDGTIVKLDGVDWEIFNPKWYRLDRWVLLGLYRVSACATRLVPFTSIERAPAIYPWERYRMHIVKREYRAFEV